MKVKFDDPTIRNLKPLVKTYDCMADNERGFGIRVHTSGTMTFFYQYKIDGQRRFMSLGSYPSITLKRARDLYQAELSKVKALRRGSADGVDPVAEKKRKKEQRIADDAARDKELSVEKLVLEYIERHAKKFKKSWRDDYRLLNKEIVALWGQRKAVDITKRDITRLLENIIDRGTPAMSNQVLKTVRKVFNFAVERDILKHTPCFGVKALAPTISRERVLCDTEIKILWDCLDNEVMTNEISRALKLILLTAQRPGEVVGMHSNEIDGNWWTIPAERSKNGKAHRVYLSNVALGIIAEAKSEAREARQKAEIRNARKVKRNAILMPEDQEYTGYIFPCPRRYKSVKKGGDKVPEESIERHALSSALKRNVSEDGLTTFGISAFTPHDLRRTAATFMASMGYMDEIIDAVLNHVKQGVIRTYNRHNYDKEKQMALEAWERKLNSIISKTENNVIPITRKIA